MAVHLSQHINLSSDDTAPLGMRQATEDEIYAVYAMCGLEVAEDPDQPHAREMLDLISVLSDERGEGLRPRLALRFAMEQVDAALE